MSALEQFRQAQSKMRDALRASPALCVAIMAVAMASAPEQAKAYEFEYIGKAVGNAVGASINGNKAIWADPGAQAITEISRTLFGRVGRSIDNEEREAKRKEAEEAQIVEQARRDVLYEAARRKEAERLGIPYGELSQRGVANTGYFTQYQSLNRNNQAYLDRQPSVFGR